jgi:hypothetical protein
MRLKERLEQRQDFRRGSQGPASIAERKAGTALNKGHKAKKAGPLRKNDPAGTQVSLLILGRIRR